jgi:hypothetical protein
MGIGMVKAFVALGVLVAGLVALPASSVDASQPSTRPGNPLGALLATLDDPAATAGNRFGFSVAVSGTTAVVGAPISGALAGDAYIYEKGASGWPTTPAVTLTDPAATADDEFGYSVAVAVTGTGGIEGFGETTAIVGAPGTNSGAGAAYVYVDDGSGWPTTPTATLKDPAAVTGDGFGVSVALSRLSGRTAVVGAADANSEAGAAYIYVNSHSRWSTTPTTTLSDPGATSGDLFGFSVAISGKTAAVGAFDTNSGAGAAYIYVKNGSDWPARPTATLKDPTATTGDGFGHGVAVSGTAAVVGAFGANSGAGAAYIYVNNESGWPTTPTATLKDPAAAAGDSFGVSVAEQGTTAIVGATATSSQPGAAYMYVRDALRWPKTPTATLKDPAPTANDDFGFSVAVWGKTAAVGAIGTDSGAGAASLYKVDRNRPPA